MIMANPIPTEIQEQIKEALKRIENEHQVQILYACESGSRAWGFASVDSDYDVRFIYLHKSEWYLSINVEHRRDVIELPISDNLDVSGWDLRKTLQLFQKSNSPLWEWLGSPIIYQEEFSVIQNMRKLANTCYSPIACQYHYFKMAKGNNPDNLADEKVKLKKYLYALRPVLAVIWLEKQLGVVPTEFQKLIDGVVTDQNLKQAIARLLKMKMAGTEKDVGDIIPEISNFLNTELQRMEEQEFEKQTGNCPVEELNNLFRQALDEVWSSKHRKLL